MTEIIIGREKELKILKSTLDSVSPEFIAIYGRRRVGKTYLIKQFYNKQAGVFFEQTGLNDGSLREQLKIFSEQLSKTFYSGIDIAVQNNWMDALKQLTAAIEKTPENKRIILFFDELPWLATRKSGFLKALEYFWNTRWSYRKKLILVVCGSAASWMMEKIVYTRGGLHNRITVNIPLRPFTLNETHHYLSSRSFEFNEQQLLQIYMIMGGIPHYLKSLRKGSILQNINAICFQKGGLLFDEFDKLFHSLYSDPNTYIRIIKTIAKKQHGISRENLINSIDILDGGSLNLKLKNLEEAGFISTFLPLGHARRGIHYRVIDEYTLFYLNWIEPYRKKSRSTSSSYWTSVIQKGAWHVWAGYAFEAICFKHIELIKKALSMENIGSFYGDWRYIPEKNSLKKGVQIDLVFDRDDDCVTLCEIKHTERPFLITKEYAKELERKKSVYKEQTGTRKQIFWCLVTANGVSENSYYRDLIYQNVNLHDLLA